MKKLTPFSCNIIIKGEKRPKSYTMFDEKGKIVLIYIYVDDIIITGNVDEFIKEIKFICHKFLK